MGTNILSTTNRQANEGDAADSGYILTGGYSRRFGSPKCIAKIGDRTMLDLVAGNLNEIFNAVYQVGKKQYGELPFVQDISDQQSPLTGIVTALKHCPNPWAFIIGCDLPNVDKPVLDELLKSLPDRCQIVLPEVEGYLQYTWGFYHSSLLPLFEEKLAMGGTPL